MHKKLIIMCYLLITVILSNGSVVFAVANKGTNIKVVKANPTNKQININVDSKITIKFSGKIYKGKQYSK